MSMSVHKSVNDDMVKPLVTRKSRQYQSAVERWSTLKQSSNRAFDRLNLRNRFEEERLLRKHRVISDHSDANLKDVFRVKDQMRVTLVDIAKSKRHYRSNESDFENRLRCGTHTPVFQMEYRRLKRKQLELGKLCEQLKGPNSKLLVSNLVTELKHVETKSNEEVQSGKSQYKGKWLASLRSVAKTLPECSDLNDTEGTTQHYSKSANNDFGSLVQKVHQQFKRASISASGSVQSTDEKSVESKPSTFDHANPDEPKITEKGGERGQYPISKAHNSLLHTDSSTSLPNSANLSSPNSHYKTEIKIKKKRNRKNSQELALPTVPEVRENHSARLASSPLSSKQRSKKVRSRTMLMKSVQKNHEVSRTESARRRGIFAQQRVAELAAKTKEDIANRKTMSPSEALNSIHQAEVKSRLQLSRSKVGIALPEIPRDRKSNSDTRRSKRKKTDPVGLPPLKIEGDPLRQLKQQRLKHPSQSAGLPKLP